MLAGPVSLLIVALSGSLYQNTMQMFDFFKIYMYYGLIFQALIPFIIYLLAEIKMHRKKEA